MNERKKMKGNKEGLGLIWLGLGRLRAIRWYIVEFTTTYVQNSSKKIGKKIGAPLACEEKDVSQQMRTVNRLC